MTKKTFRGWEKSGLDLDEYLVSPCEIDEKIYLYIGEIVAPDYCMDGLVQGGDPIRSTDSYEAYFEGRPYEDKIYHFQTVCSSGDKYYYLGVLPEFKK